MTTESTSMEHSNILHTCTGGPDWTFWQPERKSSTKHTLDLREKRRLMKRNGQTNVMQKSTCKYLTFNIYRHVACWAVTMVMTMGVRSTGGDGESPAVPSIVHAVESLGGAIIWVFRG